MSDDDNEEQSNVHAYDTDGYYPLLLDDSPLKQHSVAHASPPKQTVTTTATVSKGKIDFRKSNLGNEGEGPNIDQDMANTITQNWHAKKD